MTYPFLTAAAVFFIVWLVGAIAERWSWAPAVPVITAVVLIIASILDALARSVP